MALFAALAAASAGLDVFSGLMGYINSGPQADILRSQGRMVALESAAEADRYKEEVKSFVSQQGTAFTKSGVTLEGSPLTVLDETILTASENISAIRARGRAQQFDFETQASNVEAAGRASLLKGVFRGSSTLASTGFRRVGGLTKSARPAKLDVRSA